MSSTAQWWIVIAIIWLWIPIVFTILRYRRVLSKPFKKLNLMDRLAKYTRMWPYEEKNSE